MHWPYMRVTCLGQGENHFLISLFFINHLDFGQRESLEEKQDEPSAKAKHQEHTTGQE